MRDGEFAYAQFNTSLRTGFRAAAVHRVTVSLFRVTAGFHETNRLASAI